MSELKERLNNAEYLKLEANIHEFDYIYFRATRRKHDSGYYIFEIYGYIENNDKFYQLAEYSDVIDFTSIISQWGNCHVLCCIDIPEPSIFRVFVRGRSKIKIPYLHCSSFEINVSKE